MINNILIHWYLWINLNIEIILIQLILIYTIYIFFNSNNPYYSLLYLFIILFEFGCVISLIQFELFTGFLWVLELTIIFISTLLLLYLNIDSNIYKLNLIKNKIYINILIILFILTFSINYFKLNENNNLLLFVNFDIYENYYESIINNTNNDFSILFFSYYIINSLITILVGFLLLIGSIICITLNNFIKIDQLKNNLKLLYTNKNMFKYIDNIVHRKQDLFYQSKFKPTIRLYRKK